MKRIIHGIAIAVVVTALGGLGLSLARPDLLPSWARIRMPAASSETALRCKEHGVPEKFCTLCHKELKSSLMLCKEHGDIPEDICTLCHPELEKKYDIEMCPKGHGMPKHFCTKCGTPPSASAKDAVQDVRLASADMARDIGIETASARRERVTPSLSANAEAAYDSRRYAEVRPRVAGYLREVAVDLGRAVRKGDVLAVVDSAEVGSAKARYLTAQSAIKLAQDTYDRTKSLARSGSLASRAELESLTTLNEAQAHLMEAEQKLRNLLWTDEDLARVNESRDTRGLLKVTAPIDGTIVALGAVVGEAVEPTSRCFAIADTSRMWLWIDVYDSDISSVKTGQAVKFTSPGTTDGEPPSFAGTVTWVGSEIDPTTRTTRVRAELDQTDGRLRAHQFGTAEIQIGMEHEVVLVPRGAVQRRDRKDLVFIPQTDGLYRPLRVVTRASDRRGFVEVAMGLKGGEQVVTTGAFLLKTETMKDALGAGCTDD